MFFDRYDTDQEVWIDPRRIESIAPDNPADLVTPTPDHYRVFMMSGDVWEIRFNDSLRALLAYIHATLKEGRHE